MLLFASVAAVSVASLNLSLMVNSVGFYQVGPACSSAGGRGSGRGQGQGQGQGAGAAAGAGAGAQGRQGQQ